MRETYDASKGYILAREKTIEYGYQMDELDWDPLLEDDLEEFKVDFADLYENILECDFDSDLDRQFLIEGSIYMSVKMIEFLKELEIDSQLVLGDIFTYEDFYYHTSFKNLEDRLSGKKVDKIDFHLWVITDEGIIIDPVLNMMGNSRFIKYHEIPEPFVYHVEEMPTFPKLCPMIMGNDIIKKLVIS